MLMNNYMNNPAHPLSPLNPLSPISIWNQGGSREETVEVVEQQPHRELGPKEKLVLGAGFGVCLALLLTLVLIMVFGEIGRPRH